MGGRHAAVVTWIYLLAVLGAIILVVAKVFISDGEHRRGI